MQVSAIKHTAAVALMTMLMSLSLTAQDVWTLERCIEYAWANNLTVQKQNIEVSRSGNQLMQDKLAFIPSLSASLGHNLNWGRSVDLQNLEIIHNKLSQSTSASANASIYLLDGLSKLYSLRSSRKSMEISIQEVERLKGEISVSIAQSYLQILLSQEILTAAKESFASISEQRDRTALLVEAGSQPYSSLLEIESQLASERVQVVTAQNQVTANTLALQQLLDLPYSAGFRIAVPDIGAALDTYIGENTEDVYASAQSLPVIQSARLALDKGDIDLKNAQGQYWPKISLSASYGTFYSSSSYSPRRQYLPIFRAVPGQHQPFHKHRTEHSHLQQLDSPHERQERPSLKTEPGTGPAYQAAGAVQGDPDCSHRGRDLFQADGGSHGQRLIDGGVVPVRRGEIQRRSPQRHRLHSSQNQPVQGPLGIYSGQVSVCVPAENHRLLQGPAPDAIKDNYEKEKE